MLSVKNAASLTGILAIMADAVLGVIWDRIYIATPLFIRGRIFAAFLGLIEEYRDIRFLTFAF